MSSATRNESRDRKSQARGVNTRRRRPQNRPMVDDLPMVARGSDLNFDLTTDEAYAASDSHVAGHCKRHGVTDPLVIQYLNLKVRSENIRDMLQSGYIQPGDEADAIPLAEARWQDIDLQIQRAHAEHRAAGKPIASFDARPTVPLWNTAGANALKPRFMDQRDPDGNPLPVWQQTRPPIRIERPAPKYQRDQRVTLRVAGLNIVATIDQAWSVGTTNYYMLSYSDRVTTPWTESILDERIAAAVAEPVAVGEGYTAEVVNPPIDPVQTAIVLWQKPRLVTPPVIYLPPPVESKTAAESPAAAVPSPLKELKLVTQYSTGFISDLRKGDIVDLYGSRVRVLFVVSGMGGKAGELFYRFENSPVCRLKVISSGLTFNIERPGIPYQLTDSEYNYCRAHAGWNKDKVRR